MANTAKQFNSQAIVLSRTDFREADRILTFITPDHGKVKAIARGVRKSQAKLAGSIELFSVTDIVVIIGRGEISTLISARLVRHYGNIVKDIDRTNTAYELLKILDRATESLPERDYFHLLDESLKALDEGVDHELVKLWFKMQLLRISGHTPNLLTDDSGIKLKETQLYNFDYEKMLLIRSKEGRFDVNQIKFLRLGFSPNHPRILQRVRDIANLLPNSQSIIDTILKTYIRI